MNRDKLMNDRSIHEYRASNGVKKIVEVDTGEVKAGREDTILKSGAIGSCVVIAAYDSTKKAGAIAHVMLPEKSPKEVSPDRTRYAADAIDVMIEKLCSLGANPVRSKTPKADWTSNGIEVCLVGGGNVLKRNDDTIWKDNIESVIELLRGKRIEIRAEALGGTERRSVSLDVERGSVSYTEGDGNEKLLWIATSPRARQLPGRENAK